MPQLREDGLPGRVDLGAGTLGPSSLASELDALIPADTRPASALTLRRHQRIGGALSGRQPRFLEPILAPSSARDRIPSLR